MNPFEQMELKKSSFTKKEKTVYELIIKNIDEVSRKSVTEIAEFMKVSQATVTRFCQKLGYEGYNDFKFNIYRYQKQFTAEESNSSTLQTYSKLILQLQSVINNNELRALASDIVKAENIIVLGVHKSELPARLMTINLHKLSKRAIFIPFSELQDLEHFLKKDDLVIMFSVKGESMKIYINELIKQKAATFAMITMNDKNFVKGKAKHFVWLPSMNHENSRVYIENQIIFMIYVDILTSYIANHM